MLTVKSLYYLAGLNGCGVIREPQSLEARAKIIQWGGLECLLYLSRYAKTPVIIDFCKRINFITQLTGTEIESIIEAINQGDNKENNSLKDISKIKSTPKKIEEFSFPKYSID